MEKLGEYKLSVNRLVSLRNGLIEPHIDEKIRRGKVDHVPPQLYEKLKISVRKFQNLNDNMCFDNYICALKSICSTIEEIGFIPTVDFIIQSNLIETCINEINYPSYIESPKICIKILFLLSCSSDFCQIMLDNSFTALFFRLYSNGSSLSVRNYYLKTLYNILLDCSEKYISDISMINQLFVLFSNSEYTEMVCSFNILYLYAIKFDDSELWDHFLGIIKSKQLFQIKDQHKFLLRLAHIYINQNIFSLDQFESVGLKDFVLKHLFEFPDYVLQIAISMFKKGFGLIQLDILTEFLSGEWDDKKISTYQSIFAFFTIIIEEKLCELNDIIINKLLDFVIFNSEDSLSVLKQSFEWFLLSLLLSSYSSLVSDQCFHFIISFLSDIISIHNAEDDIISKYRLGSDTFPISFPQYEWNTLFSLIP